MNVIGKTLRKIRFGIFRTLGAIDNRMIAHIMYFEAHHRFMNLRNPQNLDEKINWMKFNTDTSVWSKLADKYEVRAYIKKKGLSETLNEIYGVFDTPEDIDFSSLPDSLVIKTTNGSGGSQVLIVEDKKKIEWNSTKKLLNRWLTYTAPFMLAEPHYKAIKPRLLIEKYLRNNGTKSLIDYKFHCFDGEVESCLVCADRIDGHAVKSLYDLNWNNHPEWVMSAYQKSPLVKRPKSLDKMIEYCKILSKGFPYVRVDWYEIEGIPVFSELTFTPAGGYNKTMNLKYLDYLGGLITL